MKDECGGWRVGLILNLNCHYLAESVHPSKALLLSAEDGLCMDPAGIGQSPGDCRRFLQEEREGER